MPIRRFGFSPDTLEYFQETNGRRQSIAVGSVKNDINRFAHGVSLEMQKITDQLSNGHITGQEWYNESARTMKLSYRAAVDVARGKSGEMDKDDEELWLALALLLFLLLNQTAEALLDGRIESFGRLKNIMRLRGGAVSGLFENWRLNKAKTVVGFTEARRVLGVAEHCTGSDNRPGCVELAELGWLPIWRMVPIGAATCRDNCKCTIQFRGKSRFLPIGG